MVNVHLDALNLAKVVTAAVVVNETPLLKPARPHDPLPFC